MTTLPSTGSPASPSELIPLLFQELQQHVADYKALRAEHAQLWSQVTFRLALLQAALDFFVSQGLEIPEAIDAVDPQARSTGKLSPRVKGRLYV